MRVLGGSGRRMAEFQEWAAARAVHLGPVDQLAALDPERLSVLDPLVAASRAVLLGEADHYVAELTPVRILVLRYLIRRGLRWVGEELGVEDGARIDRYLDSGDAAWLSWFGGLQTPAPGRRLGGPAAEADYPSAAMQTRIARIARAVREELPAGDRLHWFGFDMDIAPGLGEAGARRLTARDASERQRLDEAHQEGERFLAASRAAQRWDQLTTAVASREELMLRQVRAVVDGLPAEARFALLGHAAHLAKDWPAARILGGGTGPPPASLGTRLARGLPGATLGIWVLHGSGRDAQPYPSLPRDLTLKRGTLNAVLAEIGDVFLLPLTGPGRLPAYARRRQEVRWLYNGGCRTSVPRQADALIFVSRVNPLT